MPSSSLLAATSLALSPLALAHASSSGASAAALSGTAAMESKVKSELHDFSDEEEAAQDAAKAYCKAHEMDPDGTTCCKDSTCFWDDSYPMQKYMKQLPNVPCDKSRGDTKCEGGSVFPVPKAGICVCRQGHCVSGKCTNKTAGLMGSLEGDFSGLYAMSPAPIVSAGAAPFPLVPWLVCFFMWAALISAAVGLRKVVRILGAAPQDQSPLLATQSCEDWEQGVE